MKLKFSHISKVKKGIYYRARLDPLTGQLSIVKMKNGSNTGSQKSHLTTPDFYRTAQKAEKSHYDPEQQFHTPFEESYMRKINEEDTVTNGYDMDAEGYHVGKDSVHSYLNAALKRVMGKINSDFDKFVRRENPKDPYNAAHE